MKVIEIELTQPFEDITGLEGCQQVKALILRHGRPVGFATVPVKDSVCLRKDILHTAFQSSHQNILRQALEFGLASFPDSHKLPLDSLFELGPSAGEANTPLVTVVVCTRDRTQNLKMCLDAIVQLDYPALDLLVIDNAPSDDSTQRLVYDFYPAVRYVCEPRPGLDFARNRAIEEARGDIIAYTDDDVIVSRGWVRAIAGVFSRNPGVMAVTGLVIPHELETEAQTLFEEYGGFGRGFERKWWRMNRLDGKKWEYIGTGQCGTGANMAFRKQLFEHIGPFDPALDVGTVTNGGGDLEMFFRVMKEGYTLVYEPAAYVRHTHRQTLPQLRKQLRDNSIGLYAYFYRSALAYPEERSAFVRFGIWWFFYWIILRLLFSWLPRSIPPKLILAELEGVWLGLRSYPKALERARALGANRPALPAARMGAPVRGGKQLSIPEFVIDVEQPLKIINGVEEFSRITLIVQRGNRTLGSVEVINSYADVSVDQLRDAIIKALGHCLVDSNVPHRADVAKAELMAALQQYFAGFSTQLFTPLSDDIPVTIIIGTHDRPADLQNCLSGLTALAVKRPLEIIVVDNNPATGLTRPVVDQFPAVRLVEERRQGVSYARNAGILAASGDILITTDDDVIVSADWLERLVAHFTRPDVMAVTGNVFPFELEDRFGSDFRAVRGAGSR
jgi:O-antigen biosynthesis protein